MNRLAEARLGDLSSELLITNRNRMACMIITFCYMHLSMKTITYTTSATLQLRKLPENVRERLIEKLHRYGRTGAGDVKALKGETEARLRVGDYRIIFVETATGISVRAIGHRREIYQ
jgi:mRNA interferase RelE/StbE